MSDNRRRHSFASLFCLLVCFAGCNRTPDQAKIDPGGGTNQELDSGLLSVSLAQPLGSDGSAHIYFLKRPRTPAEEPFFVVWTDARLYGGGYTLSFGDLRLRYGGKVNDYDREVECLFTIAAAEKGQFKVDSKTYEFGKGTLFLIAAREGEVRVKQLSREPSKLPADRNGVVTFAQTDPDVKEFVSKTAKAK